MQHMHSHNTTLFVGGLLRAVVVELAHFLRTGSIFYPATKIMRKQFALINFNTAF